MEAWREILAHISTALPGHSIYLFFAIIARVAYNGGVGLSLIRAQKKSPREKVRIYPGFQKATELLMLFDGIAFFFFCLEYSGQITAAPLLTVSIGLLLCIVGISTKVAAAKILGKEGYYFKDFFVPPSEEHIVLNKGNRGIYKYLDNPMYIIGNFQMFGWALMCLSLSGIFMALFANILLQIFYFTVELPHVKRLEVDKNGSTL